MPRLSRSTPAVMLLSLAAALPACAPKRIELPTGTGSPYAEAARAYEEAVKECRGVRTMQATLGLSGRAGHDDASRHRRCGIRSARPHSP
jgi:hypothetical protein